jgi:hypothetical protein
MTLSLQIQLEVEALFVTRDARFTHGVFDKHLENKDE